MSESPSPDTLLASAGGRIDELTGAIVRPITTATTFVRDADGAPREGRVYGRADCPGYEDVERVLTALERGAASMVFASGMAAATAVFLALSPGDHVLAPKRMYWALRRFLTQELPRFGVEVELVDTENLDTLARAMRPGATRLLWLETPANPVWSITDVERATAIAHRAGARVCVDSTVATPILSQPLTLGADLVMHSATKYLNGHSDVLGGTLTTRALDEPWQRLTALRATLGGTLGGFESYLLLRGMRTLHLRVARASASAMAIAEALSGSADVSEVLYPGLPDFAGHAIAAKQMKGGYSGMLSIRMRGGREVADRVAAHTKLWKRATSLGGVESLIEHRAPLEGPDTPTPFDLLRLSVGVEHPDELLADLREAIAFARR
jgi:cystathionine gamma-synthase